MKNFKHINAGSLEEAVRQLNSADSKTKIVAGGTDLIGQLKENILPNYPEAIVNIKTIPGLDFVREDGSNIKIGALTRLADIAENPIIRQKLPALASAAAGCASPHIREMGTIAGNICQSNRCWYYWVPENRFNCMRKGGKNCYALTGDGRYHSIFGGIRVVQTPCSHKCPANIEIPDYMDKFRQGDINVAVQILMSKNPMPAVTGRVCPHTCESECNRKDYDEAVSIREVERFLGDYALNNSSVFYIRPQKEKVESVAVVGSGPSGLSAAYYLRKQGYQVTLFDTMPELGGLLYYGIPAYRLPKQIIKKLIKALAGIGIKFVPDSKIGQDTTVEILRRQYSAVFLACGAWQERKANIKGEEYMLSGAQLLRNINSGQRVVPGKKVAILGGGNVAVDVARTLLRLGSEPVIIYRRGKGDMPALKDEVFKAEEEGVQIKYYTLQVELVKHGQLLGLTCQKMIPGPLDDSGRPRPVPVPGSDFTEYYDAVMTAIGEEPDLSILPGEYFTGKNQMKVNPETGLVVKNIFAGGDFVSGPSTVVAAIAAGRKGALAIHKILGGDTSEKSHDSGNYESPDLEQKFNSQFLVRTRRSPSSQLSVGERVKGLEIEEAGGLDENAIKQESNRCLNCSCVAVNPSDLAPALIALNARVITSRRNIELENLFSAGQDVNTVMHHDEIIKEIVIPIPDADTVAVFSKFALRKSIDFPVVNCAVAIASDNGRVKSARICLNSVFNLPLRLVSAENVLLEKTIDENIAESAADIGLEKAFSLVNNRYKIKIAKTLIKRAILACVAIQ